MRKSVQKVRVEYLMIKKQMMHELGITLKNENRILKFEECVGTLLE